MKTKAEIKEKLNSSRDTLNSVLDAADGRWDAQVYSDGLQWNVRDLLAHLADAEKGHLYQVMNIAEGKDVIPEDFDIERYNKSTTQKNAQKSAEQCRQELAETREKLLAWLDNLDEEKLDRIGRHASLRVMPVRDILRIVALHEQGHAKDIAVALNLDV